MTWDYSKCSLPGCDAKVKAKAMCRTHYDRWIRYGDPRKMPDPKWGKAIKENQSAK